MSNDILVPNIGDFNNVEIIEVLIKEGQEIEKGDTVITLESDKSSVEVPSSISGTVKVVHIKIGDKVSEGSLVASLEGTIESGKINLPGSESKKNIKTLKSQIRYRISPFHHRPVLDTRERMLQMAFETFWLKEHFERLTQNC